jgi:hypothetical protein
VSIVHLLARPSCWDIPHSRRTVAAVLRAYDLGCWLRINWKRGAERWQAGALLLYTITKVCNESRLRSAIRLAREDGEVGELFAPKPRRVGKPKPKASSEVSEARPALP